MSKVRLLLLSATFTSYNDLKSLFHHLSKEIRGGSNGGGWPTQRGDVRYKVATVNKENENGIAQSSRRSI